MFSLSDLGVTWEKAKLSNGIPVNFFVKKGSPITFFIVFPVGSRMDPDGKKGIAHLLEHAIYKTKIDGVELSERLEAMGGVMNGHTSKEEIAFYTQIGDFDDFDELTSLFGTAFLNYKVADEELNKERNVVIQELQHALSDPAEMLGHVLEGRAMFAGSPYEIPIIGTIEDLRATSTLDLGNYMKHLLTFQPVVFVSGDFDPNTALSILEKNLPLSNVKTVVRPEKFTFGALKNLTQKMDVEFINASMGFRGCGVFDDDFLALDFLSDAIGSTSTISSILMKRIRKELGLVYFIHSINEAYINGAGLMITFGTEKKSLRKVYEEIRKVMERVSNEGLTSEELEFTRKHILKSTRIRFEKVLPVALAHTNGELFNPGKYHTLEMYLREIEKISNEDLLPIAQKYLNPGRANYIAVGDVEPSDLM